mmetsp:Transcript_40301/g.92528  ORF Transcript_40301/g.92528 Transcript_40301/m.92528 type:complete len:99 (-) Transcript_40301:104-400(-)
MALCDEMYSDNDVAYVKRKSWVQDTIPTNEDILALRRRAEDMTVKRLQNYLRERELPLSDNKAELVKRVTADMATEMLHNNFVDACDEHAAADGLGNP